MINTMAIVMAAGKGTRMKSDLPKVLVPVCGRPMIDYVLDTLERLGVASVLVVVGYRADLVRAALAQRPNVAFAEQLEQLGTGHAVMMCRGQLQAHQGPVIVLAGDSPMMQRDSLATLVDEYERSRPACIVGTATKDTPHGLGRIERDPQGNFLRIIEEKDCTDSQRRITEVNMSCYLFDAAELLFALDHIQANNAQGEYYVTDCPGALRRHGRRVLALPVLKPVEALSINTVDELKVVEQAMRSENRG
jgi:bifunctional UDP-N-acetylglucosamine pyrophosphorylase/glucosamine-1-phosphate N-acetyltransferase/UDP-N-acetylglucosamine pyrophosphorylase